MVTKIILMAGLIFSLSSFASTPRDISVTVDNVTYQCTPGGSEGGDKCARVINGTQKRYEACHLSMSAPHCFSTIWMKFKADDKNGCWYEAFELCHKACTEAYSNNHCISQCQ